MLTERERRRLVARATVEKKLLREHPELTDGMLELLGQAAEVTGGFVAYLAGVEKDLDLRGVLLEVMTSDTAIFIFGEPPRRATRENLDLETTGLAQVMTRARSRKPEPE